MKAARFRAYTQTFFVLIVWSIASIVIKLTLQGITPIHFLTYRFFISSIIGLVGFRQILHLFKKKRLTAEVLLYGILSTPLGLGLLFFGLNKTSVVNLSIVSALQPLLILYVGHKIFHDRLSKRGRIGVGLAIIGAVFALVVPFISVKSIGTIEGNISLILYLISDILSIIVLKKLLKKGVSPLLLTNTSFMIGFISFFLITIITNDTGELFHSIATLPLRYHLGVWYMAVLSGSIAYTLRSKAQKTLTISETSILGYLSPILSTILALIILGESITSAFIIGSIFIATGIVLVEHRRKPL